MKYPMFINYCEAADNEDGTVVVTDVFEEEDYIIPYDIYDYAVQLDGKHDPFRIPGYTISECVEMYGELRSQGLIRKSNILEKSFGSVCISLFFERTINRVAWLAKYWNDFLMLSFLPMMIFGIVIFIKADPYLDGGITSGGLSGLLLGLVLHEISHGAACIAYGGRVYEAGIMFQYFMPGAYVLIDETVLKRKMQRIQTLAAGVEMNMFLGGFFLCLASFMKFSGLLFSAGFCNFGLAAVNLSFIKGVDGSRIISELLGSNTFIFDIKYYLFNKKMRKKLMKKPGGFAVLSASAILLLSQIVLPLLLLTNIAVFIGDA